MDLFDLQAKLSLDSQSYINGLDNAEKKISGFGGKLRSGLATAGKVGAAAIGAVTVAAGALTKKIIDGTGELAAYGDTVDKMSQKMGISATAYQEWDAILQHSGSSIDSMQRGMITLQKKAISNADAFEALGISQERVASMSTEELFAATISGLQEMGESAERTALATELLGGSAKELGALLNTSAEETEQMRKRVHELGGVLSDDAVKASAKYKDSLQDMQTALSGAKRKITVEFLPAVTSMMDGLTELFSGNKNEGIGLMNAGLDNFVSKLSETVPEVLSVGSEIVLGLADSISENIGSFVSAGADVIIHLVDGISQNIPKLGRVAIEVIKSFGQAVAKNIGPLLRTLVDGILGALQEITSPSTIGQVVDVGVEVFAALVDGIIEAAPKIIEAVPAILTNLVKSISASAGKLTKAAVQIMVSLSKALIQAIPELLKAVPDILMALGRSIIEGTAEIFRGLRDGLAEALFGAENPFEAYAQKVGGYIGTIREHISGLNDIKPTISDFGSLLSDQGRTLSDIDAVIAEKETAITTILSTALEENKKLRKQDVDAITQYNQDIRALEKERLDIYVEQEKGMVLALQKAGKLSEEEAQQYLVDIGAVRDQAAADAKTYYQQELVRIENYHKAHHTLNTESYNQDVAEAQASYQRQLSEANSYYDKAQQIVSDRSGEWVEASAHGWEDLSRRVANVVNALEEKHIPGIVNSVGNWVGAFDDTKLKYIAALDEMDIQSSNAFLRMIKSTKANGKAISTENQKIANDILGSFENLPEALDEAGHDYLMALVAGMEDTIPELQNASSMTSDEIVKVLRKNLGIESGKKIGADEVRGVASGMESERKNATKKASDIGGSIRDVFDGFRGAMETVGGHLIDGIINGVSAKEAKLREKMRATMESVVSVTRNTVQIASPSKVFAEIGGYMAEGLGVGWDKAIGDVKHGIEDDLDFSATPGTTSPMSRQDALLQNIVSRLASIERNMGYDIVLNDGVLVGRIDKELGNRTRLRERGVTA